jgi:hypothetical protein
MSNVFIQEVRDYATANYGKGGMDYLVECWSDEDIAEAIGKAKSAKGAIANVKKALAPLAERREEVRAEADWSEPFTVGAGFMPEADAIDWGAKLREAASEVITGKAMATEAKAKGASALAVMVEAFASDDVAAHKWAFELKSAEGDTHTYVRCNGTNEFGDDKLEWKLNGQGKVSKVAQTAYKTALQLEFFGQAPNASLWTTASNAIAIARAIREEGMSATVEGSGVKLEGGTSDKAKAMREAKSLAALGKVAKDEAGSNRAKPNNDKQADEGRAATPEEVTRATVALVKLIASGKADACNATLSNLRAIAKLVASNPDAFAEL